MSSGFDPERIISLPVGGPRGFDVTTFDLGTLATLPKAPPLFPEPGPREAGPSDELAYQLAYHEVEIFSVGPGGPEVRRFLAGGSLIERLRLQLARPGGMVELDDADGWHVYIPLHSITQVRIRAVSP